MLEFLGNLQKKHHLSDACIETLLFKWNKSFLLKRHEFLVQPGQIENHLYFVQKGAMRLFFTYDAEEVCVGFAYPNTLICDYPSFIKQNPSVYFTQALEKCELLGIHRKDFYDCLSAFRELETCWRALTEEALLGKIQREVEMLAYTPLERFERLMARSPHLFQHVPQKYIASYLRMKPETLSRLKAKN